MPNALRENYNDLVKNGVLLPDDAQLHAIECLETLYEHVLKHLSKKPKIGRILSSLLPWNRDAKDTTIAAGLYIYGPVGSGKTVLMDMFYNSLPTANKRRDHFHNFMANAHRWIHRWRKAHGNLATDPIPALAADIVSKSRIICFDEFTITNIADALVLGRLLNALYAQGAVLVLTSNSAPTQLYKDGLQRTRFEPYIKWIEQHYDVHELAAKHDYRRLTSAMDDTWFSPHDAKAIASMNDCFMRFGQGQTGQMTSINVGKRKLVIPHAAGLVARFHFSELCGQPRGVDDFTALVETYPIVLVADVPSLEITRSDEAIRFQTFVDVAYDHKALVLVSAVAQPDQLFHGQARMHFQRTISRLIEMRSHDYQRAVLEPKHLWAPSGPIQKMPTVEHDASINKK